MNHPARTAAPHPPRPDLSRSGRLVLALLVAIVAGVQLAHFATWAPAQLAECELVLDDAYFYSVLARSSWAAYLLFCVAAVWGIARAVGRRALIAIIVTCGTVLLNPRFQAYAVQGSKRRWCSCFSL